MSDDHSSDHGGFHPNYIKIYVILVILLIVSVVGPEFGIGWLTLITAFGVALVKAYMVCAYFMHMKIEKKYIWYMMGASLFFMLVFFSGVAPDIMKGEGTRWDNTYDAPVIDLDKDKDAHGAEGEHSAAGEEKDKDAH